jgi:hypothetical protein
MSGPRDRRWLQSRGNRADPRARVESVPEVGLAPEARLRYEPAPVRPPSQGQPRSTPGL